MSEGWSRMQQAEVDMNGESDSGKDSHSLSCFHIASAAWKRQMLLLPCSGIPTHSYSVQSRVKSVKEQCVIVE